MLFKPTLFVTSTLVALAAATPLSARIGGVEQCTTVTKGSAHCCNSSGVASTFSGNALWPLINLFVSDLTATIGLQCSPIIGGGSCNNEPICCTGNNYLGGLIVVGCSPIVL